MDMKSPEIIVIVEIVDAEAKEYFVTKGSEDCDARCKALRNSIWVRIMSTPYVTMLKSWFPEATYDSDDIINRTFLDCLNSYSAEKGNSFCLYFNGVVYKARHGRKKKSDREIPMDFLSGAFDIEQSTGNSHHIRKHSKEHENKSVTEDVEYSLQDERTDEHDEANGNKKCSRQMLQNNGIISAEEERQNIAEMLVKVASVVTQFYEHNKGNKANVNRYMYTRIFFTEKLIMIMKTFEKKMHELNENELMSSAEETFLDYTLMRKCRSIWQICDSALKRECDIFPESSSRGELKLPFESKVLIQYLKVEKGMPISAPAISQQKAHFDRQMNCIFSCIGRK